jgi:hypothetical protein
MIVPIGKLLDTDKLSAPSTKCRAIRPPAYGQAVELNGAFLLYIAVCVLLCAGILALSLKSLVEVI